MGSAQNTDHLFVYGTLRKEANHPMSDLLQKYIQQVYSGIFQGKLFDVGSFPAAIPSDSKSDIVHGELYKIKDPGSVFRHLDPYEGYNPQQSSKSLFLRKKVTVQSPNKDSVNSWIYLYNRPVDRLTFIPSGDYLSYLKNKTQ